jgi:hypothetical protein
MPRRNFGVSLLLAAGCFGDPPAQETDGSTGASADATTGTTAGPGSASGDDATPGTSADTTSAPTSDTDAPGTATDDASSTGPSATCGDGVFEIGELCPSDEPAWSRAFEGDIVDLALAAIAGDPGDGGVLVLEPGGAMFYAWAWDGISPAGPSISPAHPLMGSPAFALAADVDVGGGDELLVASTQEVVRFRWDGAVLTFDGPCAAPGPRAAIGQLDDDDALEMLWVPDDGAAGLLPWLDLDMVGWCDPTPVAGGMEGKPNVLAIGPFVGDSPDDVAFVLGSTVHVSEITVPFALGPTMTVEFGSTPVALQPADLDGDGARDELVIAGAPGVAAISVDGAPTISTPTPAGTIADLAVADLDGDGDDDVVVVDITAPSPLYLLSTGIGTFQAIQAPIPSGPSSAVAAGDLDGDAAIDLVLGGIDGTVRVFMAQP